MNKNKTIILIVCAIVVVVVCVVLAGKYIGTPAGTVADNSQNVPSPIVSATSTATGTTASAPSSGSVAAAATTTATVPTIKTYRNESFAFSYPLSWKLEGFAPVSIDNFNGAYEKGSVIPMGGAEIDVVTTTLYSGRINDILGTELLSATGIVTSTASVNGVSCVEAQYTGAYVAGIASENMAAYCLRGLELWKLYLSYRAGDPAAAAHVTTFTNLLDTFKFL